MCHSTSKLNWRGCQVLLYETYETYYQPAILKFLKRLSFWNFEVRRIRNLPISNENVEDLALRWGANDNEAADFICHCKEVKKLSIHDIGYPLDYKDRLKLNKHLPKLTEFQISSRHRNSNHQALVKFVLGISKQLSRFSIEEI